MDMQTFMNTLADHGYGTRQKYHLKLGELIEALESANKDAPVYLIVNEQHRWPTVVGSYRGYYSDLAIEHEPATDFEDRATVEEFLAHLKQALDSTMTGYKGGEFTMDKDTPLWADFWGQCNNIAVMSVDVDLDGTVVTIHTKKLEYF